ncbi:MAG: hypothetical protein M4579_001971 [Chaenotheca gracillima]|nr:MAG: hypothetical protein M4579_001971 [Chaenotheca gracillima]
MTSKPPQHHDQTKQTAAAPHQSSISALDEFIHTTESRISKSEARSPSSSTRASPSVHPTHLLQLAAQIVHNLQYQHDWTSLTIHTHCIPATNTTSPALLPRPIVSGVPPRRLYVHPDEQVELLMEKEKRKKETRAQGKSKKRGPNDHMPHQPLEPQEVSDGEGEDEEDEAGELSLRREWVLPSHIQEKWSLRQFASIFDAIDLEPPAPEFEPSQTELGLGEAIPSIIQSSERQDYNEGSKSEESERNAKRVLLATVNDDSTIVYYIMHDGLVKPRQN